MFSKSQLLLATLAAAKTALAHTTFTEFYIDGVSNGPGTCVRMNHKAEEASFPIEDLSSNDMACGFYGSEGVSRVCDAEGGSKITFEFHSWANDKSKPILDPGHKGPCAVYMKKVDSAISDPGHGDGWFKIWDMGYVDGTWCTNKVINDGGFLTVEIPNLESGNYLIRPELLALHAASSGDPQYYTGCAQVFLGGSGNLAPKETVSIPGYTSKSDPSNTWNIYYGTDPNNYPVPGPKVATFTETTGTSSVSQTQSEGQLPAGCILSNANFCAYEVTPYTDETGCWASGQECWDQQAKCWDEAPATGGAGCDVLKDRCSALNDECRAKNFNGPPDAGKMLNHVASTLTFDVVAEATRGASPVEKGEESAGTSVGRQEDKEVEQTPSPSPSLLPDNLEEMPSHYETPALSTVAPPAPATTAAPENPNGNVVYQTVVQTAWETKVVYQTLFVI